MSKSILPRKMAVVTATRAEFGLLSHLITLIKQSPVLELQLFVTGAHLIESQGMTVKEIEQKGYSIAEKIELFANQDASDALTEVTAKALSKFGLAFQTYQADAVVVLGDRYELLGICSAALLNHVPIIHLHGGEVTEGAMDEAIRHAVTKMASLHFVAADSYQQRVIQMGEQPKSVFNVGALGLDIIQRLDVVSKPQLSADLNIELNSPLFVITFHPVTWGSGGGIAALNNLFTALEAFSNTTVIWTAANTDEEGEQINSKVREWVEQTPLSAKFVYSLGSQRYLSLLKQADVVIGNSSSGIIEAPAIGIPTVNIGDRQKGRLMAKSVIQSGEDVSSIQQAIQTALNFEDWDGNSLYGKGRSAEQIVQILEGVDFNALKTKKFFDISH